MRFHVQNDVIFANFCVNPHGLCAHMHAWVELTTFKLYHCTVPDFIISWSAAL